MKRDKKRIKNESNWWQWLKDKVRFCTRRADWSIWFYLQDWSMLCRTKEYSLYVRNCGVGWKCPLCCWLSYWRAEPKWGNFQTAALSGLFTQVHVGRSVVFCTRIVCLRL